MGSLAWLDGLHPGVDNAESLAECMHLEASLGAWPKPRSTGDTQFNPKYHAILGATLNDNGDGLWTATETSSSSRIAVTGYKRRRTAGQAQWVISHSFAAITGVPREAHNQKVQLHILSATNSIAVVFCTGAVFLLSITDSTAYPLRLYLDHFSAQKSRTLVRQMRRDGDPAPVDMLTHVRFYATRRCVTLEHYAVAQGPRAAKGKVTVEASLQPVWESCLSRTIGYPVPPAMLLDCAWTVAANQPGAGVPTAELGSTHAPALRPHTHHSESGMLVALDTIFLRISPAAQRRLQEDSAGVRKDLWVAHVLDLPVVAGPLPSLHEDHSFTGYPSEDSIPDFNPLGSPAQPAPSGPHSRRVSNTESSNSSQGPQQQQGHPASLPQAQHTPAAGSVLAHFFRSNVTTAGRQSSPSPSAAALSLPQDYAPSSFSSRISALYNRHAPNGSIEGGGRPVWPTSRRRLWILPLASSTGADAACVAAGSAAQLGYFLVVSPPFVIAVDAMGQPDPRHAMLDIAASLRSTHLEGSSLIMLDVAVVADKLVVATHSWLLIYEWVSATSNDGYSYLPEAPTHHLELVQHIVLPTASFANRPGAISLLAGPRCHDFVVCGPLRVSLYAPEVPAKRALRMVMKGDVARALHLLQAEVVASRPRPESQQWLQRVIGMSVALCLRQDKWLWALKLYALADPATLHPAQLLSAILPALFAVDTSTERSVATPALLAAAKECVRATVQQHCEDQHSNVRSLFDDVLEGPPSPLLMSLAACQPDVNQSVLRKRPLSVFSASHSPALEREPRNGALPHTEAKAACRAMAATLADTLEGHKVGASGGKPGHENFPHLLQALSAAGELYPNIERGLPGRLGYTRGIQHTSQNSSARSVAHGLMRARNMSQSSLVSLHAMNGASTTVQGLDHLDWCKAAQIWLLQLAGDRKELEAVCWRPGLWGQASGRQLHACEVGHAVGEYLGDVLQDSNEARAAGLLLQAVGSHGKALDTWMGEYDAQCSQIGLRRGIMLSSTVACGGVPLHECQTLEDHVIAAATLARQHLTSGHSRSNSGSVSSSATPEPGHRGRSGVVRMLADEKRSPMSAQQLCAASRALLLAANAAECMCDHVAVPVFTDSLISWLLRLPGQCALAVLLSRADLSLDEVFSPNHALWCSRSDDDLSRNSQTGTEPSGTFVIDGHDSGSACGSDGGEAFSDRTDPALLWLQIRYLTAVLADVPMPSKPVVEATRENGKATGFRDGAHGKLWALYLSQLLKLALISADGQWDAAAQAACTHSRYGPQVVVEGFAVEEAWMAPEFISALWHTGASNCMAELLLPLRPVMISPQLPQQSGSAASKVQETHAPDVQREHSFAESMLHLSSYPSATVTMAPELEPATGDESRADSEMPAAAALSPVASLFCKALHRAPASAIDHIRGVFEELHSDPSACSAQSKQLFIGVLEQQGTQESLMQAMHVLAGCGHGSSLSCTGTSLRDLCASVAFVARHSGAVSGGLQKTSSPAAEAHLCEALWNELIRCSMGPNRVLVQYYRSQLMADGHCSNSSADHEPLEELLESLSEGQDPGKTLLKDAAPAVSSLIQSAQGHASACTLQRFMLQQCKMSAARKLVALEDSYVKWNEGPTSMDITADAECVTMYVSDPPQTKRFLPPPGKGGSPWCGVCKRDIALRSAWPGTGRYISWPTASFVCQDPACIAAAVAATSAAGRAPSNQLSLIAPTNPNSLDITSTPQLPSPLVSTSLKLRLSLTSTSQSSADAAGDSTLAAAVRFGHFWSLSEGSVACLRRHEGVGGGLAEASVPSPAPSTPRPLHQLPISAAAEGAMLQLTSPRSFALLSRPCAHISPNPDDPAVALIATGLPMRDTYDSFQSAPGPGDVLPQHGAAAAMVSHHAPAQPAACIVRAVERTDEHQSAAPLQLLWQGIHIPSTRDAPSTATQLVWCAWGGGGAQGLLCSSRGTILCVDAHATESASEEGSSSVGPLPQIAARTVAAVPQEFGEPTALAVVRLGEGEAVLIATDNCLLAVSGQGAVGALRRCGAAPGKWSTAVAVEAAVGEGGAQAANSSSQLAVTQAPTASSAHAVWVCGGVLHTFDVGLDADVWEGSEYAQGAELLHAKTYCRMQLPHELARSLVSAAVLPRFVLLLTAATTSAAAELHAIWRASGRAACSMRVYEGIGRPISLIVDPEDPEVALEAVLAVHVVGAQGTAKVEVDEPLLSGAWDLIHAGRFAAAETQIQALAAGPMGPGPVVESAMWGALGSALMECGHRAHGARILGKILPGVVSADTGDAIPTFQEAVLQFCGADSCRKELRTFLASKLETLARSFQSDVSMCGVATWLLELELQDLHLAQLRAAVAPVEAGREPGSMQARICSFIQAHQDTLESRTVLELLGHRNAPALLLFALETYGMHVQAFHIAVREKVPKAVQLLEVVRRSRPEVLPSLVSELMWHHPIATCTALAAGRSIAPPDAIVSCAHVYAKPARSPYEMRVQDALQQYLASHIASGNRGEELHGLYVRLLALGGHEDDLVKYIEEAGGGRSAVDASEATLAVDLCFDTREALVLSQRCGLNRAARALLLLRGDYTAAVTLSEHVQAAADSIACAPAAARRELWLQFARRQASGSPPAGLDELHAIIAASDGRVQLEDLLALEPQRGAGSMQKVAELVGQNLGSASAKLALLDKQFEGFGDRMASRRMALQNLQRQRKERGSSIRAGSVCAACGSSLLRKPKHGRPSGGMIPSAVAFPGGQYHTACAVHRHLVYMGLREQQRWRGVLDALSNVPLQAESSGTQEGATAASLMLEKLRDFLTRHGDPLLSKKLVSIVSEMYGEREADRESELLQLPGAVDTLA